MQGTKGNLAWPHSCIRYISWLLPKSAKHSCSVSGTRQGACLYNEGGVCLSPEHRLFCLGASVQTARSWELPRLPGPPHPSPQCPSTYPFNLPVPPCQENETSTLTPVLGPPSFCLRNYLAAPALSLHSFISTLALHSATFSISC